MTHVLKNTLNEKPQIHETDVSKSPFRKWIEEEKITTPIWEFSSLEVLEIFRVWLADLARFFGKPPDPDLASIVSGFAHQEQGDLNILRLIAISRQIIIGEIELKSWVPQALITILSRNLKPRSSTGNPEASENSRQGCTMEEAERYLGTTFSNLRGILSGSFPKTAFQVAVEKIAEK